MQEDKRGSVTSVIYLSLWTPLEHFHSGGRLVDQELIKWTVMYSVIAKKKNMDIVKQSITPFSLAPFPLSPLALILPASLAKLGFSSRCV